MIELNDFSLLSPSGEYKYFTLSEDAENDLSFDYLISNLSKDTKLQTAIRKILCQIPCDRKVIEYRQQVYSDLKNSEAIYSEIMDIFNQLEMEVLDRNTRYINDKSSIWELYSRLKELESYSDSIIKLHKCLANSEFKSEGIKKLKQYIDGIYADSGFNELSEDIKKLGYDSTTIKSITLGINLDEDLRPFEAGIVSVNPNYFSKQTIVEQFLNKHRSKNPNAKDLNGMTYQTHPDSISEVNPLMNNLTNIVEKMLGSIVKDMKRILKKYTDISGFGLLKFADEINFYISFAKLEKRLREINLPCCISDISQKDTTFKDFYNVKLAICRLNNEVEQDIVCNDVYYDKEKSVLILTGPNRGGKTIFTQGIGLAFVLFQSGVFVPCSSGELVLCDGIYTHFPVDENKTVSLGRFGEEADRLSKICSSITGDSLLLFNESFATTSHAESLFIAQDVLKYLCHIGARVCFNTHIFELAENIDEINNSSDAKTKADSIVMGIENGERLYKISFEKPQCKSYAEDIAKKYGITYKQLCEHNN